MMKLGLISLAATTVSISLELSPFGAILGKMLSKEKKIKVRMA